MKHMLSSEILEQFRAGKKEFSGIHTQFCEFDGIDLSGIIIRNSELDYTSFRNSNMKNAKLINCKIFFFSLYNADVENVVIDRCGIDTARFDNMRAKNTKITNSQLSYTLMFGTNTGEMDLQGTTEFKVWRNASEITEKDIIESIERLGESFETLPIEVKSRLRVAIKKAISESGRDPGLLETAQSKETAYDKTAGYNKMAAAYGALDNIMKEVMAYGNSEAYKQKSAYESSGNTKKGYRDQKT